VRLIYTALFYGLTPLILARLAWRSCKAPAYRRRWGERFALYSSTPANGVLWFHAVSVGEAEAAFPLVRALGRRFPHHPILVTTTTPTGSARVREVLGESVRHVYLPYDLPDCVARFLDHYRPVLAVVMETEIWPNLYRACGARGIPLAIVNARLSDRSAQGYARLRSLAGQSLTPVNRIAAQTSSDAERFIAIGAKPETVVIAGNIKFDLELPEDLFSRAAAIRAECFGARPVWIAASTHEGEEAEVLRAFEQVRRLYPELLLMLVPRHPERFDKAATLCRNRSLTVVRRTEGVPCAGADVFILDTMGELRTFYAAGDIAFVGGSLVPVGGHNVLEPALAGLPVLFGPYMRNFEEAGLRLREAGGAAQIADAEELAHWVAKLLENAGLRGEMAGKGRLFVESGRGALGRVESLLADLLVGSQA
jgi:3-deoxy-D-manno-octulosonic-acid transferase